MTPADIIRVKELLPTSLGTDETRARYAREILARSVFSARMASAPYLAKVREVCAAFAAGEIGAAAARERLLRALAQMGHPTRGVDPNDLRDHASERRLNLIVETQREMAASVAQLAAQNEGTLAQFPGWLLTRLALRRVPRKDWGARWRAAGESVGWTGAYPRFVHADGGGYVALKSSPVWAALGDGTGGFRDALGNPFPPFAYSSGLGWLQVDRAACERLGLLARGETPAEPERATLSPAEREIADAARRYGLGEGFFAAVEEEARHA